jgi:hypothetical protein
LENTIAYPIVPLVDGLGATLLYSAVGDVSSCGMVCSDGSSSLGMAHLDEASSERTGFLGVVEEGFQFRFSGWGEYLFHNTTINIDGAIEV